MTQTSRPPPGASTTAPLGASPPRSRLARTVEALALRDFRLLWSSTVLSGFGQWGQQIALNWLVFVLTGSAVQLGAVSFVAGLISLGVTPFAGLLADRYPRRMVMFWSSAFGAAIAGAVGILIVTDLIEVWHAYVFALLSGLSMAINQPARQAAVFDTSTDDTLQNAVALNSIAQNLSRIVGPPLAGVIAVWSLGAAFTLITLMRGLAAVTVLAMSRISRQETAHAARRNPVAEIWDGFRYLAADPRLAGLWFINALPALIVYPYIAFLPVFADRVFGSDADVYGLLLAMMGVGSTVGLLILTVLPDLQRRGRWMLLGFLVYLAFLVAFARSDALALSLGSPRRRRHRPRPRPRPQHHPLPGRPPQRHARPRDGRLADGLLPHAPRRPPHGHRDRPLRRPGHRCRLRRRLLPRLPPDRRVLASGPRHAVADPGRAGRPTPRLETTADRCSPSPPRP